MSKTSGRVRKVLERIGKALPDLWDALAIVGAVLLIVGVFTLAGQGWGVVFTGAVLLIAAAIGARYGTSRNST